MKGRKREVPTAMVVQLSRLFGGKSKIATKRARSDAEWRGDLKLVLDELWNYLDDPMDDKFLALAVTGQADLILTGDDDLLVLHPLRGVDILNPRQYLDRQQT